jgi:hypothetical protein
MVFNIELTHQLHKVKGRYDDKTFKFSSANPPECGRLLNALLTLFDMHLSKKHIRLKVPSGEYGSIFVAFKRFIIMSPFQIENSFCSV